jgi:hypothetical protein
LATKWAKNGQEILAIALHPERPDTVYAGGKEDSLFKSVDGGKSWQPVLRPAWPDGCEVHALILHPIDPERVFVGLNGAEISFPRHNCFRGGLWTSPDGKILARVDRQLAQ